MREVMKSFGCVKVAVSWLALGMTNSRLFGGSAGTWVPFYQ